MAKMRSPASPTVTSIHMSVFPMFFTLVPEDSYELRSFFNSDSRLFTQSFEHAT
jgi:hypothetical protein